MSRLSLSDAALPCDTSMQGDAVLQCDASLRCADALECYADWPAPVCIHSDGPYGLGLFPKEPRSVDALCDWYAPHVAAWSAAATPETTLWFWGSEESVMAVYPLLTTHGWKYAGFHVWDKGATHIAGKVNSRTVRSFPVTTEACVRYVRATIWRPVENTGLTMQQWMRAEWRRTGLPWAAANDACGVKSAATRKYLAGDHVWYMPPPEMFGRLARYANAHGDSAGRPYFSLDGEAYPTEGHLAVRAKWHHTHGVTNVWSDVPPVRGSERIKAGGRALHPNQKPLALMERILAACTDPGDVVWDPFAGLASFGVAARRLRRRLYAAEINRQFYALAAARLEKK